MAPLAGIGGQRGGGGQAFARNRHAGGLRSHASIGLEKAFRVLRADPLAAMGIHLIALRCIACAVENSTWGHMGAAATFPRVRSLP